MIRAASSVASSPTFSTALTLIQPLDLVPFLKHTRQLLPQGLCTGSFLAGPLFRQGYTWRTQISFLATLFKIASHFLPTCITLTGVSVRWG